MRSFASSLKAVAGRLSKTGLSIPVNKVFYCGNDSVEIYRGGNFVGKIYYVIPQNTPGPTSANAKVQTVEINDLSGAKALLSLNQISLVLSKDVANKLQVPKENLPSKKEQKGAEARRHLNQAVSALREIGLRCDLLLLSEAIDQAITARIQNENLNVQQALNLNISISDRSGEIKMR